MMRLGLVDFDTSHVVEFTRRLNHVGIEADQWVEGARVVAGVPGHSFMAPERIGGYAQELKGYGVELVDQPTDLFGKVDAVLITSLDGGVHLERAQPFLERGIPTFVDKPFACSVTDARAVIALAERHQAPLMSCSSLRFAPEVVSALEASGPAGTILGASTHGPAPIHPSGRNPGLFHYGIHPVELLCTLLGPGCRQVTCSRFAGSEFVSGVWSGDRLGSVRGLRAGCLDYGFTVYGHRKIVTRAVETRFIYHELLRRIVSFFETGTSPVDPRLTLEIIAILEAINQSAESKGRPMEVAF